MNRAVQYICFVSIFLTVVFIRPVSAQDAGNRYSILFGWKTEGSPELLSRQSAAFLQLKDNQSLSLSFGALLGPTMIVRHDTADQYLKAARAAGLDYLIPAAPEFMFGVPALKRFADTDEYPRFISANVVDEHTRTPIMDPYATWYVSGLRICIVALSDTNIIRDSKDDDVRGIDILSYEEALDAVSAGVAREKADIVMVAGRMDRSAIEDMAAQFPFIDVFITNNQAGGFSGPKGTTSTAAVLGKPVYIGPETSGQLGRLTVSGRGRREFREFTTVTLGDAFPPDKDMLDGMNRTIEGIRKRDYDESMIVKTGGAIASALKTIYAVDAVFLERQSLYYFPLADSLTIFNVRNIIKPYEKLAVYDLKGSALKSILADSGSRPDPDLRLIIAGLSADGKVDSIPVIDDILYSVLTTTHLRAGGNGFSQFRAGTGERLNDINMLSAVESFLVEKDERIQRMTRPKLWELVLNLSIGSNFNRTDVDADKETYDASISNSQFRGLEDQFFGFLRFGSEGNRFTYKKRRHKIISSLNMVYQRNGTKSEDGVILYQKTNDYIQYRNHYEYDRVTFGSRPYMDITVNSTLYSAGEKHPLNAMVSTGLSKNFPKLWLSAQIGVNGIRDYSSNVNRLGTNGVIDIKKTIPAKSFLTAPAEFTSRTEFIWNPTAQAHSEFSHENSNRLSFQLMKKLNLELNVRTYSYTNNTTRRTAFGVVYDLNLNYSMQWKL